MRKACRMKRLIMVAMLGAVCVQAQEAVRVEPTDGGAIVSMDMAGGAGRFSRAWKSIKSNKWTLLGTAAAAVTVDRIAYNNDWLWYESNGKSKSVGRDDSSASASSITVVEVSGNNNTVTVIAAQPQSAPVGNNGSDPVYTEVAK